MSLNPHEHAVEKLAEASAHSKPGLEAENARLTAENLELRKRLDEEHEKHESFLNQKPQVAPPPDFGAAQRNAGIGASTPRPLTPPMPQAKALTPEPSLAKEDPNGTI